MSDRERVREAVQQGLRKCRVEDGASVGLFRDSDLFHISHMVAEALMQTPAMRDLVAEAKADALREAADFCEPVYADALGAGRGDFADGWRQASALFLAELRERANPYRETSKEQADD